jgi:hypothetical protein
MIEREDSGQLQGGKNDAFDLIDGILQKLRAAAY